MSRFHHLLAAIVPLLTMGCAERSHNASVDFPFSYYSAKPRLIEPKPRAEPLAICLLFEGADLTDPLYDLQREEAARHLAQSIQDYITTSRIFGCSVGKDAEDTTGAVRLKFEFSRLRYGSHSQFADEPGGLAPLRPRWIHRVAITAKLVAWVPKRESPLVSRAEAVEEIRSSQKPEEFSLLLGNSDFAKLAKHSLTSVVQTLLDSFLEHMEDA